MPPSGRVALLMIDWQRDFLEEGGFGHALGNDVSTLRRGLGPAAAVLAAARACGVPIVHTLEAHQPDLGDLPAAKLRRCAAIGKALEADPARGRLLVAGEPGNAIVEEVAPLAGELVLHKPGKGAFCGTALHDELRSRGVTHLIVTGVTTEVCVQSTLREANDRGYDCLVVSDATESYFPSFKQATLEMVVAQGAIVGWSAASAAVIAALRAHAPPPPPSAADAAALAAAAFPLPPPPAPPPPPKRTLLAVSGTLQDGFELRGNLDHPACAALLVGGAVCRGVKAYLDVKEPGCREHRAARDGAARVNPANVVTGDRADANLYALYLVHEAVVLKALLGEPPALIWFPRGGATRVDPARADRS